MMIDGSGTGGGGGGFLHATATALGGVGVWLAGVAVLNVLLLTNAGVVPPADARVAGKVGYSDNYYSGKSYSGINDELIMVSIVMAIIIAVLIGIALCYIVREKCNKHQAREYYVTA